MLDSFDAGRVKGRGRVGRWRKLLFGAKYNFPVLMGRVLGLGRWLVALPQEEVPDVAVHREAARAVAMAWGIIPGKVNAREFVARPIFRHFVVVAEDVE